MVPTPSNPVATLVFFLIVFTAVGVVFLFIHMLMGSFIRPYKPDAEKLTIYECGEPTVGSAWIQFDVRFYVVALLFVIFDVEVAFFFPWAVVFGKANQLANTDLPANSQQRIALTKELLPSGFSDEQRASLGMMKVVEPAVPTDEPAIAPKKKDKGKQKAKSQDQEAPPEVKKTNFELKPIQAAEAASWASIVFWDIAVFFGVLMVGFAYVWRRGDIDWVRSYTHHQEPGVAPEKPLEQKSATQAPA